MTAVEKQFKIEKSKQILLVSGGEVLEDAQRKFYGVGFGCEESPIYLIDKTNVEKTQPPLVENPLDNLNQDYKQDIQTAIYLKPSFQTLQTRSLLTSVNLLFFSWIKSIIMITFFFQNRISTESY